MLWSKLCKLNWNCAWNLAFPVFISPIVWNMCENLHYESVYFKELHSDQEYYWPTIIYRAGAAVVSTITSLRGCVTPLLFILFNFANYSPSIAMEHKARKKIASKWLNQRSETNKYVYWTLFLKLQAGGINFEKLLGWTVFKTLISIRFSLLQFLPIRGICCFCCVTLNFL